MVRSRSVEVRCARLRWTRLSSVLVLAYEDGSNSRTDFPGAITNVDGEANRMW